LKLLAVQAAKVTNIILREAMGLDNPFRAVLKILPDRPRLGGIQSALRACRIRWCFLSKFLTVSCEHGKDQPQFRFLNESLITRGQLGLLQSLVW